MENLSTLMGKYGEEGDRLLFKVLNSGDYLAHLPQDALLSPLSALNALSLAPKICEKGLRYDLTVPFARYVVMHRGDLTLPFKRYQIQPVWRADRPQKGRYREFYQCDADVIGTESLLCEVDLLQMADDVFSRLGVRVAIKLNNRKVLAGIAEVIGAPDALGNITVAIDKIDKIGLDAVKAELASKGLSEKAVEALEPVLTLQGDNEAKLTTLQGLLIDSSTGSKGVEELRQVVDTTARLGLRATLEIDPSLARGLNYYTGTIIEVKAQDTPMGSISGGGRYDNLTGIFGMPGMSGVGISFGADRIYDVIDALGLWPDQADATVDVVFLNMGPAEALRSMQLIKELREAGISCELYPEASKIKKQMAWANARRARHTAIIGGDELAHGTVTLKDMAMGTQQQVPFDKLIETLTSK